jgi:hypothetical protein
MHCPRCGQQQASDYVKFCSRCGFLLELIPEILANGGVLPQLAELEKGSKKLLTRRNGIKLAVLWTILMWVLFLPFFGILGADELAGAAFFLGFGGGVILLLISFFFLESTPKFPKIQAGFRSDAMPQNLAGGSAQNALPPQQSVPVSSYIPPQPGKWQTTSDLTTPGSVTEQTTKLLKEDEK